MATKKTLIELEEIFKKEAEEKMLSYTHKGFKRDYKTLFSVIISSMDKAQKLS